ncbi:SnoaL-like domain-containing protein [Favolaschia claudopus]|uniref:SnoaL-like domain-containing protein n=1 Tax=Favolaschia claudopus TaxID=2862362 RepID=A0AAW0BG40_9AGAR
MAAIEAKQLQNSLAFLSGMSATDFDGVAELLSPNFTLEFFPASLPPPGGKPKLNGEETLEWFKRATQEAFEHIIFLPPLHVVQGRDAVVLHVKSDGMSKSGKKYQNEYMFTFQFFGEKIVSLRQFVDSKYFVEFFAKDGV